MARKGWFNESHRHSLASKGIKTGTKVDSALPMMPKQAFAPKVIEPKQIIIRAKRWFDKINGNTYHSVRVYVDGKLVGEEPFAYGYDEAYLQTAHDLLVKAGYYPYERTKENINKYDKEGKYLYSTPKESENKHESYYNYIMDMREHPDKFLVFADDVTRKGDMMRW